MKNYFALSIIFISFCHLHAQDIEYVRGVIERQDSFSGTDGWAREPLRAHLAIPREVQVYLFGAITLVPELSITAKKDGLPIGQRNCGFIQDYLDLLGKNTQQAFEKYPEQNIQIYLAICQSAVDAEWPLVRRFQEQGIPLDAIVHNAGLMVLKPYENQGIGTNLQQESMLLLKERGIKVIISETTNEKSAKIMKKLGFTYYTSFSYKDDFHLEGFDGTYTIWYKELI